MATKKRTVACVHVGVLPLSVEVKALPHAPDVLNVVVRTGPPPRARRKRTKP